MWEVMKSDSPPISAIAASHFSAFLLVIITCAPAPASALAIPLPMPADPPVTSAVFPLRSNVIITNSFYDYFLPISFHGPLSARGSLGSPNTRSPTIFRCTSEVPA